MVDYAKVPYLTAKMLQTFLDLSNILGNKNERHQFKIPLLFVISSRDQLCEPQYAYDLYGSIINSDKNIKILEDAKHEAILDIEESVILQEISEWVQKKQTSIQKFEMPVYIKFEQSSLRLKKYLKLLLMILALIYVHKKKANLKDILKKVLYF